MKINQLKIGVILSYASIFTSTLISIFYTPIMLRLLGQNEYGLYSLSSSVVSYLSLLSFGFGGAFIRYYSRYKANKDNESIYKLNGMYMIVFICISILAIIAGIFLVSNVENIFKKSLTVKEIQKARVLMSLMIFNLALSFPNSVLNSIITANEKFFYQKSLLLLQHLLNPILVLPLLLLGFKSISMIVIATILSGLMFLLNLNYCLNKLKVKFIFNSFNFLLLKEIIIFSSYIFLGIIIDQINWNVDKFLLGIFKGTIGVAIYAIGAQFNSYFISFSTAVSNVFVPKINRIIAKSDDNWELTLLFTKVGRIQFIILSFILIGFTVFGRKFIHLWAGENYDISYYIALLLMFPILIPLIQNLGIEIQKAKNLHKFRSVTYFIIAIGNLIISIPLCKAFGEIGCAIGTALCQIFGHCIIMNIYYHKKIGLNMMYFWKQIIIFIPSLLIPIFIGVFINIYVNLNSILNMIFYCLIYIVAFFVSMWFIGMNKDEKNIIKKPISKLLLKMRH